MDEYLRIANKQQRLVLGVMTGTSLDGLDLALVRLSGSGTGISIEMVRFVTEEMPDGWRTRIRRAFDAGTSEICRINFDLGHFLSDRIIHFCKSAGLPLEELDAIGCHGQTIYHVNQHSTLQTGEADVIANRTRTLVISDFRTADIAAGGSGAPLVPYLDQLLFKDRSGPIALQNIGGISNVTYLPGNMDPDRVTAFDTGPGNAVLNETVEIMTNGQHSFDHDGFLSRQGQCNRELLSRLLEHPYFRQPPPKSTGREEFGAAYVEQLLRNRSCSDSPNDLLRTLVSLVTHSIADAYGRHFSPMPDKIYLSGGGIHHPIMLEELKQLLGSDRVAIFDSVGGISADAKEAVAFAVLAHERINNVPTNLPAVTGAGHKTVLGKISAPYIPG